VGGLGPGGEKRRNGASAEFHADKAVRLAHEILLSGFQQALLGFFLALDAVASPRHGVKAFGVDLFAAGYAFSEAAFADAGESAIDHIEQLPVVIALTEEEFLVVGTGGAVGDVLGGLIVDSTTVLLIADNHVAQFLAPGFQFFSERL
jgi:hypothetical protein